MSLRAEPLTDSAVISSLTQEKGVDDTIRYLYRSHFEMLSRYVINNNGSHDDAQDIFQEVIITFIHVVKGGKFRGESSIGTFLFSLNRNIWLNELKRRGRAQVREMKYEMSVENAGRAVDEIMENRQASQQLLKIMGNLGETCQKILLLFYFENRSMKEILDTLHYENEQVVRNKKYKCLKKLEEMVTSDKNLYHQLKNLLHG